MDRVEILDIEEANKNISNVNVENIDSNYEVTKENVQKNRI